MKLQDLFSRIKRPDLNDANCIKVVVVIDLILGGLIVYLGGEALINVQTWLRWSGVFIQIGGLALVARGWSLISRYRLAITGQEPWWAFDRAVAWLRCAD